VFGDAYDRICDGVTSFWRSVQRIRAGEDSFQDRLSAWLLLCLTLRNLGICNRTPAH